MPNADQPPIGLRLTRSQRLWLEQEARRQDRSLVYVLRKLVEQAMLTSRMHDEADQAFIDEISKP